MFEITLLRHGESTGNAEGYFQGQTEYPLSEIGKEQAKALARKWKNEKNSFDKIICSPLIRAKQTAEIINGILKCPIEFDPIWMERDNGNLAGMKREELIELNPRPEFINLYDPVGETGESDWDLFLRGGKAWQSILQRTPGKYLIVSHGGILNKVMNHILGIKPLANFQGIRVRFYNTGYAKLTYSSKENRYRIININERSHIDGYEINQWPYQFTLLRHGESEGNAQQIFQGQADYPLSQKGREQASAIANLWALNQSKFSKIITSPLLRARETAEIVARKLDIQMEENSLLKEVNNGKLAGLTLDRITELFPVREGRLNPYAPIGETGETWYDLYLRAGEFLQGLMDSPPGCYLIVAHGGIINSFLWAILGIVPGVTNHATSFHLGNTSYATLGYRPTKNSWRFIGFGNRCHLKTSAL